MQPASHGAASLNALSHCGEARTGVLHIIVLTLSKAFWYSEDQTYVALAFNKLVRGARTIEKSPQKHL